VRREKQVGLAKSRIGRLLCPEHDFDKHKLFLTPFHSPTPSPLVLSPFLRSEPTRFEGFFLFFFLTPRDELVQWICRTREEA